MALRAPQDGRLCLRRGEAMPYAELQVVAAHPHLEEVAERRRACPTAREVEERRLAGRAHDSRLGASLWLQHAGREREQKDESGCGSHGDVLWGWIKSFSPQRSAETQRRPGGPRAGATRA